MIILDQLHLGWIHCVCEKQSICMVVRVWIAIGRQRRGRAVSRKTEAMSVWCTSVSGVQWCNWQWRR